MSKNLQASVKLKTSNAERALDRLAKKINSIQEKVSRISNTNDGVTRSINRMTNAEKQHHNQVKQVNREYKNTSSTVDALTKKVGKLAAAYTGIMGAKAVLNMSDTITSAQNRLNYVNGGDTEQTQLSMDKMYASAQKVRIGYDDMMKNVSKSITLAGDAFDNNIDNAIRFQEIMSEAYTIGGASAAEMSSSMYQMIQALGSGILQGDELRSVREGAPIAYKEIEKFAQGVYNTNDSLKDMASQGMITSELVVAAMMNAGDGIDKAFKNTDKTFAQAFNNIKNTAIKSFEPVLERLNDALNSSAGTAIINGIGYALQFVAGVLNIVFDLIQGIYNFIVDHWQFVRAVLITLGILLGGYLAYQLYLLTVSIVTAFTKFILLVYESIVCIIRFGVAAAASLLGVNLWLWIIIAVIAIVIITVAYLAESFADACGMIVGVVFAAGALIYNLFVGVINGILQLCWGFCEPFISIVEWVLNAANGGFNSFGGAVANLIGQIIGWFLSLGKIVTKIIDAIFGTNWTAGLESLKSSVESWGKNDEAVTIDRTAPELQRIEYGNAYDTGYALGSAGGEWITDKVSGINEKLNIGNLPSATDPTYDVTNAYDPSNMSGLGGTGTDPNKTLKDISDDTSTIADAVALSSDDLEYLRKIAALEWKKEFTTANITVDMKNYNTVNSDGDLDGIVTTLTRKLYEELDAVADGVYA